MASGVIRRQERRTNDQAGIRAVELRPDFNMIQVCLVENVKGIKMLTKCMNIDDIFTRLLLG